MDMFVALYLLIVLLALSSICMIGCKSTRCAIVASAVQAATLCGILMLVEGSGNATAMDVLTLACKAVLVPLIVLAAVGKTGAAERCAKPAVTPASFMVLSAVELVASCFIASAVLVQAAQETVLLLALALALFFVGLTAIVTQRDLFRQVFGYLIMEGGCHLMLAVFAPGMPELAEVCVTAVSVLVVAVMCVFAVYVSRSLGTLNTDRLHGLKG